jgi:hypothetical protein
MEREWIQIQLCFSAADEKPVRIGVDRHFGLFWNIQEEMIFTFGIFSFLTHHHYKFFLSQQDRFLLLSHSTCGYTFF